MVVHCNYGLRGAESDGDESFVRDFCQERRLSLVPSLDPTGQTTTPRIASKWRATRGMTS